MIGDTLLAAVPVLEHIDGEKEKFITIRLISVDAGGIWVESQEYTDWLLKTLGRTQANTTPVLFLPFGSIDYLTYLADLPSLSAASLGLEL